MSRVAWSFRSLALVVWITLALLVIACAASLEQAVAESRSDTKVVLRAGWTEGPDNLNPFIGYLSSSFEIWRLNYNLLVGWDAATLTPEPELAESWKMSDGGRVWDFTIRKNVKWNDGRPLTAADVEFTFNYVIDNDMSAMTLYTKYIKSVKALDEYTVRFICTKPKASILAMWVPILPEHIWKQIDPEAAADTFKNPPPIVGSGPFKVVEFKSDNYVRLVANEYYWGERPAVDEIVFATYQNVDSMAADIRSGKLDIATGLPAVQIEALDALPDVVAHSFTRRGFDHLGFNCYDNAHSLGHPVLLDADFRRALNYAVDKEMLQQVVYSDTGTVGSTIVDPNRYSDPDWHWSPSEDESYYFDLKKAAEELDAAGYIDSNGDGLREFKEKAITLRLAALAEDTDTQKCAKMVAGWFKKIGLRIKLEVMDEGALSDDMWHYDADDYFAPDFDMFVWDWYSDVDPCFILSVFTSAEIESWSDTNWSNAEYDKLNDSQETDVDPESRKATIDKMQKLVYEETPAIILMYPPINEAYNVGKWEGWVRSPEGTGSVWYTGAVVDTYLNLQPKAAVATGGGNAGIVVAIVVAVVVAGGLAVFVVRRRRRERREY